MTPSEYSFIQYLSSKKSVDDRALNRFVWERLASALPPTAPGSALHVFEAGAGIGTMFERTVEWGLLRHAHYTALDAQTENIQHARRRLANWGPSNGFTVTARPDGLKFSKEGQEIDLDLIAGNVFPFIQQEAGRQTWDLLVAHAFLDLLDLPAALPQLFKLLRPEGLFYFPINFDGLTALEPQIDPVYDELVLALYHHSMDERLVDGKPSGDSRTGRHLFAQLRSAGAQILAAGSSDWVVFANPAEFIAEDSARYSARKLAGYPGDEAYFLHFIIHTIHLALVNHPELDAARFQAWIAERHAQVDRGELVYIAHQLDILGQKP
jgi:SAM-dependent methyltransferase